MGKKSKKEAGKELNGETPSDPGKAPKPKVRKARAKTTRPKKAPEPSVPASKQPSDEEIRMRAYFIAERRMQLRLEGDSVHDWMEARRQLIEEAKQRSS